MTICVQPGIFSANMTTATLDHDEQDAGAWQPGIRSALPAEYLPLSTLYRPENVSTDLDAVRELHGFTGLPMEQLVRFRPERLVVHELLIRVSADIFVTDGSRYEDLGVNFRGVVDRILSTYIEPHMAAILADFDSLRENALALATTELERLSTTADTPAPAEARGFSLGRLFGRKPRPPARAPVESLEQRHANLVADWKQRSGADSDALARAVCDALARLGNALLIKHGRIVGAPDLLATLASGMVCNRHGSETIGEAIAPLVMQAAAAEGYRVLPVQAEPVVVNVKGASASGKSTMRPLQRLHVERLGLQWEDFALISPDIWRKYLLDYDSLGEAARYAGTLTGDEVPIIDARLDRYIANKAAEGRLSHLLIDRFRFDSFAPSPGSEEGSNLLTRFGHTVYMIFMVTPPASTVERAWLRGLQVGRFKAVDDLLYHNIEAFTGIPVLFFTWALHRDKRVYYEFLDNSVPHKQSPRTIAFGMNGAMYVVDFKCMLDIVRYTKIRIDASRPEDVYPGDEAMAPEQNTGFIEQCAARIPRIGFVDRHSGRIYAEMEAGQLRWIDRELFARVREDADARSALDAIAPEVVADLARVAAASAKPLPVEALSHIMGELLPEQA